MKKTLLVMCLLSAGAAFGQYYSVGHIDNQPVIYAPASHPAHAGYVAMTQEQSILATANYSSAQGERPASDFPQVEGVSLGLYAREMKKQRINVKKARVVWVNQ